MEAAPAANAAVADAACSNHGNHRSRLDIQDRNDVNVYAGN